MIWKGLTILHEMILLEEEGPDWRLVWHGVTTKGAMFVLNKDKYMLNMNRTEPTEPDSVRK